MALAPLKKPALSPLDLVAGLSLAGLLASSSIAYARIGQVPPQAGLVATLFGLLGYSLLGRSRFAIVAPTSSSATVMAAATASLAGGNLVLQLGLSSALVMLTGLFFMLAGLLRLGRVSDFIARPVLRGFTAGLAVVICSKQLATLVGYQPQAGNVLAQDLELLAHVRDWQPWSVLVGLGALLILGLGSRHKKLPVAFAVIVLGIAANRAFGLHALGVAEVGAIELQLQRPHWPQLDQAQWQQLAEMAVAVALMIYGESCTSIRTYALLKHDPVDANRDLWALGLSNLGSGLFNGMPVGAGYSQTSASVVYGAQGKATAWVALAAVLLLVGTCLPLLAATPEPVLAAIVIASMAPSLNPGPLRLYFSIRRSRLSALAAALGAVFFGVLDGLVLGMAMSFVTALLQLGKGQVRELGQMASHPGAFVDREEFPAALPVPGLLILRPEEALAFANAEGVMQSIRHRLAQSGARVLVLSLERSPDLDGGSLESLVELIRSLREQQVQLLLVRLSRPVIDMLRGLQVFGIPERHLSELNVLEGVHMARRSFLPPLPSSS